MKKKSIMMILLIAIVIAFVTIMIIKYGSNWLLTSQYNQNGISHFLVVTVDWNQPKKYIGNLENKRIFIENLNIEETNFRSVKATNVSIKEAIDNKWVSLDEWKKYAWKTKRSGDVDLYQYDNYEIACAYSDCIIRPVSK